MFSETVFRRDDGTKYKIRVKLHIDIRGVNWGVDVLLCPAGKRRYVAIVYKDSMEYRYRTISERISWEQEEWLKHVTEEEIVSVKLKLWETLKPTGAFDK